MLTFKNISPHTIKIPSELLDDSAWDDLKTARPAKVSIAPNRVVRIRDEFALRSRSAWAGRSGDETPAVIQKSRVEQLCPQLKPEGVDSIDAYETTFHDEIPAVMRMFEESKRATIGEAADRWVTRESVDAQIAERVKSELAKLLPNAKPIEAKLRED